MILSKETWTYIAQQQKVLDKAFMTNAKWQPSARDRKAALRIELAEFVNEFPEQMKWWKHKDNDSAKILDEYVDILHFMAGYVLSMTGSLTLLQGLVESKMITEVYTKLQLAQNPKWERFTIDYLLQELLKTKDVYVAVALATYILERECFEDAEIRTAYDRKNAENFERIEAGY